ncbi:MAG: GWxTD domain-containing protein [Acidobacteriota bacterium]|nr:GWxTD domain-containing protein [Acidobacteriota bacterium]MDQ5839206.1 GWxTD domain-containing protein [Acidobacteriota bacterium]
MPRIFLLLVLAALACAPAAARQRSRKTPDITTAQLDLKAVYQKWLDEDVVYIITPQERKAFSLLVSDTDRERFIEEFWKRRNPDPAAKDNAYRAEHYRRIAYANQNFGGKAPGWRTDRGRIYITLGAPDEIRQTPTGEVWFYKVLPSLGHNIEVEFVNDPDAGDLRLRQQP